MKGTKDLVYNLNIRVPAAWVPELRRKAKEQDRTVSALIRIWIREHLEGTK